MPQQSDKFGLMIMALIILAIGLVSIFYPQVFWWMRIGRKAKHISPVAAYIMVLRIGGVLTCGAALYLIYYIIYMV